MDSLQRAIVSLLIDGDELVPSEITALLGVEPRLGVSKGELFVASQSESVQARTGTWQYGGDWESPPDLDRQIAALLGALSADGSVWEQLTSHFRCYVSVGGYLDGWTGGMTLQSKTLRSLTDRGLTIDFDLYVPSASD